MKVLEHGSGKNAYLRGFCFMESFWEIKEDENGGRGCKMLKERKYLGTLFLSISFLLLFGCREETQEKWWSQVQFVDSTYTQEQSEYFIGETVYILFTGEHPNIVPETLPIRVWSNFGDDEEIGIISSPSGDIDTLINPRIGKIRSEGNADYERMNGILEVDSDGDTIFTVGLWKCFPCKDTAYIKPRKGGGE